MTVFIKYRCVFYLILLFSALLFTCIEAEDHAPPIFDFQEPEIIPNIRISDVLEMLQEKPIQILSQVPLYLEAYVVSNDMRGNFHKALVIQDKPINPTAGVAISTQATNMYTHFEPGRKVYFRVDGLYLGSVFGLPSLGGVGEEISRISQEDFDTRLFRSTVKENILPRKLSLNKISRNHLNTLIQLDAVEFLSEYEGLSYSSRGNAIGTSRLIQDCSNNTIALRTNSFADFAEDLLPTGNGSVVAVLSTFYNSFQLFIRDTKDVHFDTLRCNDAIFSRKWNMPFIEDFTNHSTGVDVALTGWTNRNKIGGKRRFEIREFEGNKFVQISSLGSKEKVLDVWLVTPRIHLNMPMPRLSFDTKDSYYDSPVLKVYLSIDFTGDPFTKEWINITDQAVISSAHSYWEKEFTHSGEIDVSSYIGERLAVGFRYSGSDPGVSTAYQIDNIQISTVKE